MPATTPAVEPQPVESRTRTAMTSPHSSRRPCRCPDRRDGAGDMGAAPLRVDTASAGRLRGIDREVGAQVAAHPAARSSSVARIPMSRTATFRADPSGTPGRGSRRLRSSSPHCSWLTGTFQPSTDTAPSTATVTTPGWRRSCAVTAGTSERLLSRLMTFGPSAVFTTADTETSSPVAGGASCGATRASAVPAAPIDPPAGASAGAVAGTAAGAVVERGLSGRDRPDGRHERRGSHSQHHGAQAEHGRGGAGHQRNSSVLERSTAHRPAQMRSGAPRPSGWRAVSHRL